MEVHDILPERMKKILLDSLEKAPCYLMSNQNFIGSLNFPGIYVVFDTGANLSAAPTSLLALKNSGKSPEKMITYVGMSSDGKGISARLHQQRKALKKSGGREYFTFFTFLKTTPVSAPSIELMLIKHFNPAGNITGVEVAVQKGPLNHPAADHGAEAGPSTKKHKLNYFSVEEVLKVVGILKDEKVAHFSFFSVTFRKPSINRARRTRSWEVLIISFSV